VRGQPAEFVTLSDDGHRSAQSPFTANSEKVMTFSEFGLNQKSLNVPVAIQVIQTPGHASRTAVGGRTQWVVSADRWVTKLV
jgi:hypothetical protein